MLLRRIAAGVLGLSLLLAGLAPPAAAQFSGGAFFVRCTYTGQRNHVDPIVSPGVKSAHGHIFFGTRISKYDTSSNDLRARDTNCLDKADKSGYWIPTIRIGGRGGELMFPENVNAYYLAGGDQRVTIPDDTKLVSTDVIYNCGSGSPYEPQPYKCPSDRTPRFIVRFNSPNNSLPDVRVDYRFTQDQYKGFDMNTWWFASDGMVPRHGDFFFGWDRARFEQLMDQCLNPNSGTCGSVES